MKNINRVTIEIMIAITIIVLMSLVMGCEKDIMTDLKVTNRAYDGTFYFDSIYMVDLDLGSSYTFPVIPGEHQVDLVRQGYIKSEKIIIYKGHNEHDISLCADCH